MSNEFGYSTSRKNAIFICGCIISLSMTLSAQGIGTIQRQLLTRFDAMSYYSLLTLLASVGMVIFLPIAGKFADLFGRKIMLIIGGIISLVSSLVTGLAPNLAVLLVARCCIGIGTAFLTPIPPSIFPFVFDREKLPTLYGIQGAMLAIGAFFGATIAGWFSDRGMAWLGVAYPGMISFVAAAALSIIGPDIKRERKHPIDFPGVAILAITVIAIMYTCNWGKIRGWGDPLILVSMVVIVIGIIAFVLRENKAPDPIVPVELFKNLRFTGAILCCFFIGWYGLALRVYMPLDITVVLGLSATMSGTVQLPRSIINMIAPLFLGAWVAKNSKQRNWISLFSAGVIAAVGCLMMSFVSPVTPLWIFYVAIGITGLTESLKSVSLTPSIQANLTKENMASGGAMISFAGTFASTIGSVVLGLVFDTICPDASNVANLNKATNAVFIVCVISSLIVALLALLCVRPKKEVRADFVNTAG